MSSRTVQQQRSGITAYTKVPFSGKTVQYSERRKYLHDWIRGHCFKIHSSSGCIVVYLQCIGIGNQGWAPECRGGAEYKRVSIHPYSSSTFIFLTIMQVLLDCIAKDVSCSTPPSSGASSPAGEFTASRAYSSTARRGGFNRTLSTRPSEAELDRQVASVRWSG